MAMDYRKSHLNPEKGESYHTSFLNSPYRSMVWEFEKGILNNILMTFYKGFEVHHLDFACGTGRILAHYSIYASISVGVDVSPSMLEVARNNPNQSELFEADLAKDDVLGERKFNLITAFRFFPNADQKLRMSAMRVLTKHLEDNGYLVFNNHKNTGSTRNRLARLCGRRGYKGMSIADVKALLAENGLELVKVYHLCVFPASEKHMVLPKFLLRKIEAFLSKLHSLQNFGENLIFVCCRSAAKFPEKE